MVETSVGTPEQAKAGPSAGPAKQPGQGKKPRKPMDKPTQAKFPVKVPKGMSKTLDPPTMKKANDESKNKPVTNESLVAESAFAVDSGFVARNREIEFHPSIAGWTQVVDDAYAELRNDSKVQVSKELPIEAFRYYAASTFWLRAISLKLWQGQDLTPAEVDLQRTLEGKTLVLPDPIHLGLKSVGRVTTKNGEVLAPTFPATPSAVVDRILGLLAVVDENNHNVYEDYPVVGVALPRLPPTRTDANRNLQGFDTLKPVRQDCTAVLHDMGFVDGALPRTIANTGINYNALKVEPNILSRTDTFKLAEVDVFTIPSTGSLAQIIETIPTLESVDVETRASNADVTAQSYANGTTTQIGITEVFGLNAWKGTSPEHPWDSWGCITWTPAHPPPERFVESRNALRDLPPRFNDRVFYTGIVNLQDQRKMVVLRLARHPS